MIAQRDAWAEELLSECRANPNILVLDADLATSTKSTLIAGEFPEQFLQMGIAEQNMVGVAAGLASTGFIPWVSTFGVFLTQRSLDQIRMLVSQTDANVKFAGHYTGLLNGAAGKTHQDIQDLAILRSIPGLTVITPADAVETAAAVRWANSHQGPVYLRLARDAAGELERTPGEDVEFAPGTLVPTHHGDGGTVVISAGVQSVRTQAALKQMGSGITGYHAPFLKPLPRRVLLDAIGPARHVITVEEHSVIGGLGGLVAEALSTAGHPARLTRIGLADEWSQSAPNEFLLDHYGLSAERVAEQIAAAEEGARR